MLLEGRKALVTGGSSGIGKATVEELLERGVDVKVFDQKEPSHEEVEYYEVNVRDGDQVKEAFQEIEELDILINNAGVYFHTPISEFDEEKFYETIDTNIKGYRIMFTQALPLLQESKDGQVVNIGSALSEVPEPYSDLYSGSKAFIDAMTTSWANSYSETGVRVNIVQPGPVKTPMLEDNFGPEELEEYRKQQSNREFSEPEDIANAVMLLVEDERANGRRIIEGEAYNNQYGL